MFERLFSKQEMTKVFAAVLICSALQACASAPQNPPMSESMYEAYATRLVMNELCFDQKYTDPAFFSKSQDAIYKSMLFVGGVDVDRFVQVLETTKARVKGGVPSEEMCRRAIANSHSEIARARNF